MSDREAMVQKLIDRKKRGEELLISYLKDSKEGRDIFEHIISRDVAKNARIIKILNGQQYNGYICISVVDGEEVAVYLEDRD